MVRGVTMVTDFVPRQLRGPEQIFYVTKDGTVSPPQASNA